MRIRRSIAQRYEVQGGSHWEGKPCVEILNGKGEGGDTNRQSIVLRITNGASVLLAGDTDGWVWENKIVPMYGRKLRSDVLLASHHGSRGFFDADDEQGDYVGHLDMIQPKCTIISVGQNKPHGHPDPTAVDYYKTISSGLSDGTSLLQTNTHGSIAIVLKDDNNFQVGF